jgi:hypothetical protein
MIHRVDHVITRDRPWRRPQRWIMYVVLLVSDCASATTPLMLPPTILSACH